jgi:succinyl-diaminopimelate desuccinylase
MVAHSVPSVSLSYYTAEHSISNWGKTNVGTAEMGVFWAKVTLKGKSLHASQAKTGVNVLYHACKAVEALRNYGLTLSDRKHALCGDSQCTVTMIKGGYKENVVPYSCEIVVDRRVTPKENMDEAIAETRGVLERIREEEPRFEYDWQVLRIYEACEVPANCKLARVVRKYVREEFGCEPRPWGTPYSSDIRNLINDGKMEAVTFGPGDIIDAHTIDESISLDTLKKVSKVVLQTILDFWK